MKKASRASALGRKELGNSLAWPNRYAANAKKGVSTQTSTETETGLKFSSARCSGARPESYLSRVSLHEPIPASQHYLLAGMCFLVHHYHDPPRLLPGNSRFCEPQTAPASCQHTSLVRALVKDLLDSTSDVLNTFCSVRNLQVCPTRPGDLGS